jgi:D-hexose-6-phosphate mutarotase
MQCLNQQRLIQIVDAARDSTVRVTSTQPDAVVWNPWVAKSKASAQH